MELFSLSAEDLRKESLKLANEIKRDFDPDTVVFIAKAGFPIAEVIADVCGAELIGISAARKGSLLKRMLSPLLRHLPRGLLRKLRRMELRSGVHTKNPERNVSFLREPTVKTAERVLIVDDSADTGHSFLAVMKPVAARFPQATVKTAALNVWAKSEELLTVDYSLYRDTALQTPMSNDSPEHGAFLKRYRAYLKTLPPNGK